MSDEFREVKISIDPEFRALIPPLTMEEYAGLEFSILNEGCRDALIVWGNILIDGHNRYEICQKNKIEFHTRCVSFQGRDDAIDWIYSNQLSRRNLTDESRTYLLGKQYEARKKREPFKGNQYTNGGGQNDPQQNTAEQIGDKQGVSPKTVKRAAEYANAIDTLTETLGKETTQKILQGEINTTKNGIVALSKETPEVQKEVIESIISGEAKGFHDARRILSAKNINEVAPVEGKYRVIYADPPWSYCRSMNETYGSADKHYPTMPITDICEMTISEIAEDNAVLFLWTTSPQLEDSFKVINEWGFKYKASFIWNKMKHVMGHYNSVQHEILLVATRGSCTPEVMKLFPSVVSEERIEHSVKPETFRTIIDTIYPSGKRIELFAREKHAGWETWGNQI